VTVRARLRRLFDGLFRRRSLERAMSDEMALHIDLRTADLARAGVPPDDAPRRARAEFGNMAAARVAAREAWGWMWFARLGDETRYALRGLRRSVAFSVAAVVTLALGVGGTSAVFTVVNGVLLRPLSYPASDRLVSVSHTLVLSGPTRIEQSDATYLLYRRDSQAFGDIGIYRSTSVNLDARPGAPGTDDAPLRVSAVLATPSVLHVLGAGAMRGRAFTDADAAPGAPAVAIISHALWTSAFGADSGIIGRRVAIDGAEREIIGVAPQGFGLPAKRTDLWLPLVLDPARTNSAAFDYNGIARLRDGVTPAGAAADLGRLLPQVPVVFPGRLTAAAITATTMQPVVEPLRDVMVGNVSRVLWTVLGAVTLLLLIACANVANLFLARAEGRQREFAVRRALGAGRALLLLDALGEALVLSAAGGVLGLALAVGGVMLLQRLPMGESIPRLGDVRVDGLVVAFTIVVSGLASLAVSVLPALRSGRAPLAALLGSDGRTSTGTRVRHRARRALVISQVSLALMLVAGAALFARSFQRLSAVRPGFDPAHALAFRLALPPAGYPATGDAARAILNTLQALRSAPGVQSAGAATRLPLDAEAAEDSAVFVEDYPTAPGRIPDIDPMVFATPGYFHAMAIPLVAGRLFGEPDPSMDPARAPREVVVSEAFAKRYWTAATAVGRRIRMNPFDPWSTIVGVVGSTRDEGLERAPAEVVYNQLVTSAASGKPWSPRDVAFVVRGAGDAAELAAAARSAVRAVAPSLPLYRMMPLIDLVSGAMARTTFTLLLLAIAAAMAMAIGAAGIYGVIAYLVALRTREIAVRLALGAEPATVRRMVVRRAVGDAAIGVAVGLLGAAALTRGLGTLLFNVGPTDPAALASASALMLLTAVVASWLPARRAARLDPASALRGD
jgi:putative ABC transport system permease protein